MSTRKAGPAPVVKRVPAEGPAKPNMIKVGDSLKTPILEIPKVKFSVGYARHAVQEAGESTVSAIGTCRVSPRRSAPTLTIGDGTTVVLADKLPAIPVTGINGILSIGAAEGASRWLQHDVLSAVGQRITAGGLDGYAAEVASKWTDAFRFRIEQVAADGKVVQEGLRPPQIGALHAIGAHWSLNVEPATVVMPTGTGKTETMLATLIALVRGRMLVVVPTRALRDQTSWKFLTLGLLRKLRTLGNAVPNPVVGVLEERPVSLADMALFEQCNVVVATIGTVAQGTAAGLLKEIASRFTHLVIDEAHHVTADSWAGLRDAFAGKPVLQFTATPFRRDGKPVDGKLIYSYPLHQAQADGYFKRINFRPVFELDETAGDHAIAEEMVARLRADLQAGFDHVAMARCETVERAKAVLPLYETLAPDLKPILIYSDAKGARASIELLRSRRSRIVVCVNMLGEGFDLPQLKVAGVHDTHKSLAVLLQFTGRFTRSAGAALGEATVVANIANPSVSTALERLYDEDADWNKLLREFSSKAARDHAALVEFMEKSERLTPAGNAVTRAISPKNLIPKFSAVAYRASAFTPKSFHAGLPKGVVVQDVWLNQDQRTLFFVARVEPRVEWSRSRTLRDTEWHLFVLYYNPVQNLLYVHSSDRESLHQDLAKAVTGGTADILWGDTVFRSLGNINRLVFQNIGLKKVGRRNLRFAMYTGADVAMALGPAHKTSSTKSNVSGTGFASGHPVTIGCSYKGRVWSREQGPIQRFIAWCDAVGQKLIDPTISTDQIVESVLIPSEAEKLPDGEVLSIDWPREFLARPEDGITLSSAHAELPISLYGIEFSGVSADRTEWRFRVFTDSRSTEYAVRLGNSQGFAVTRAAGDELKIRIGKISTTLEAWFNDYPPNLVFVDGSELDGNLLVSPQQRREATLSTEIIEPWNWTGVNITRESYWKDGAERPDSIQFKAIEEFGKLPFTVIFDDDAAGEAADLVCIGESASAIDVALVHCKFTSHATAGERVKDVVDVASQAVRSGHWAWRFPELCKHLLSREVRLRNAKRPTRFLKGDGRELNHLVRVSRFKPVHETIVIVQPGLSKGNATTDQLIVLGAAQSYLLDTSGAVLRVVASP